MRPLPFRLITANCHGNTIHRKIFAGRGLTIYTPDQLTASLKGRAAELGFAMSGACRAATPRGFPRLGQWLQRGYAGQMDYLARRHAAYAHPEHVLPGVRSLVMLAMPYQTRQPAPTRPGYGRVARYAWGEADYHDVIRQRLHELADLLRELAPQASTRCVVDTAPLMEREFAMEAGLGWIGKNTLLLNQRQGSYFFLAALLTDVELAYDDVANSDHCGACTACLDACPTDAFPQPYVLDASRCISYLTIELRDAVPRDLRRGQGDWVFGCDVCQEVCPWNRFAVSSPETAFAPSGDRNPMELAALFEMTEETFRERFRHTPLWRPHRRGLLRSAAIVLGNQRFEPATSALILGLNDVEPVVRGAAAWALRQIGTPVARAALSARQRMEHDAGVQAEISDVEA